MVLEVQVVHPLRPSRGDLLTLQILFFLLRPAHRYRPLDPPVRNVRADQDCPQVQLVPSTHPDQLGLGFHQGQWGRSVPMVLASLCRLLRLPRLLYRSHPSYHVQPCFPVVQLRQVLHPHQYYHFFLGRRGLL